VAEDQIMTPPDPLADLTNPRGNAWTDLVKLLGGLLLALVTGLGLAWGMFVLLFVDLR